MSRLSRADFERIVEETTEHAMRHNGQHQPLLDHDQAQRKRIGELCIEVDRLRALAAQSCRCDELRKELADAERHAEQSENLIGVYARRRIEAEDWAERLTAEVRRLDERIAALTAGRDKHAEDARKLSMQNEVLRRRIAALEVKP